MSLRPKHARALFLLALAGFAAAWVGCSSVPAPKFHAYVFPKNVYLGDVGRPYAVLGPVRSRVDYPSLDPQREEKDLCRNYFNKAARDLLKYARKQGADAVIDLKSVVFLVDGRTETYSDPECSDDGAQGQVLAQGVAIRWTGEKVGSGTWVSPLARAKAKRERDAAGERAAREAKVQADAKAAQAVALPKTKRVGMPMMPEGGTFARSMESDEPEAEPALAEKPVPAEKPAPVPAVADSESRAEPPVTFEMQDSSPGVARRPATKSSVAEPAPVRGPRAGESPNAATSSSRGSIGASLAPARAFADPRLAPPAFRDASP
jgi:hypothetical protein